MLDISLNGPDGLDLLKHIRARDTISGLILSMMDESLYAERGLRAGANGYIMKQQATEQVLVAIRRILGGEIYVSERMANKMLHVFVGGSPGGAQFAGRGPDGSRAGGFPADRRGQRNAPDRRWLHLSIKTVESYQAHIKDKLLLKNGRELVQRAIQWNVGNKQGNNQTGRHFRSSGFP